MIKRILIAFIFLPFFVYLVLLNNSLPYCILITVFLVLGLLEFYQLFKKIGIQVMSALGITCGVFFIISNFNIVNSILPYTSNFVLTMLFIASASIQVFYLVNRKSNDFYASLLSIFITLFGVFYIFWLGRYMIFLAEHFASRSAIFLLFAVTWAYDSFAYFVGSAFGKHKLFPTISPKKSLEGLIGGIGLTIIVILGIKSFTSVIEFSYLHCVIISILLSITGQIGDLFESIIKRYAGVKDSSALIPGHGGILDKLDSFLFNAPVLYYYLYLFL
ncbi:MAG: phosphatidate cytidylyltransferase [Candidatus Firestonebacteria bacterium]